MKIYIDKQTYLNNPCPKITKEMWDWYYESFARLFYLRNHKEVKEIKTIHIRINQAYKGCSNIHFYTTINHAYPNSFTYHSSCFGIPEKSYQKRYMWMVDLINSGIDLGTTKPIERYERELRIRKLKGKTKDNVKRLINEYKYYLRLSEKFHNLYHLHHIIPASLSDKEATQLLLNCPFEKSGWCESGYECRFKIKCDNKGNGCELAL